MEIKLVESEVKQVSPIDGATDQIIFKVIRDKNRWSKKRAIKLAEKADKQASKKAAAVAAHLQSIA